MQNNNSKPNLNTKITIVAVILLLVALIFFYITKNADDQISKALNNFDWVKKNSVSNQSPASQPPKKLNPESIDKAEILLKKTGVITWDDIIAVSPDEQRTLYSGFDSDQKEKLIKTWNDLKASTNGDPSKTRN